MLTLQQTLSSAYIEEVSNKTVESGLVFMPIVQKNTVFADVLINTVTTVLFPISLSLLLPVFLYLIVLEK